MNEQLEKFLSVLSPKNPMVFRSISARGIPETISKEDAISDKTKNVYFLWGVRESAQRMTDNDIELINYIRLDIDIKKWVQESMGVTPDKWDIEWFIGEIKWAIETNAFLKDWSYIVFSGWGCHIYYSAVWGCPIKDSTDVKVWQLAMKRIYALYDKTITENLWEDYSCVFSDKAVCNTARIMRLPWSVNQKNWATCSILYEEPDRQSPLLGHVRSLWLDELKKKTELSKVRQTEIEAMKKTLIASWGWDTDLKYEIINRLPAYIIAQVILPMFVFDWKKNFKDNWKLKGYYYVGETNSICNWGSEEFAWGTTESCWNNFSLIERHLSLTKAQTFKWFEEKFKL